MSALDNFNNNESAWLSEVEIDLQGRAVFSQRAVSRLCGVHHSTIQQYMKKLAGNDASNWLQPLSDIELEVAGIGKILDITAAKFLAYYSTKNGIALVNHVSMSAVGLRAYVQKAKGWNTLALPQNY